MNIFSFFKNAARNKKGCDWCGKGIETPKQVKHVGQKKYSFCSESCKKNFRKAGLGKQSAGCPTCMMNK